MIIEKHIAIYIILCYNSSVVQLNINCDNTLFITC